MIGFLQLMIMIILQLRIISMQTWKTVIKQRLIVVIEAVPQNREHNILNEIELKCNILNNR